MSSTSPRIQVPEWQRSYSWGSEQVDQFWADLAGFSSQYPDDNIDGQEYFLGSIVLVTGGPTLLLLDGQQRLATATILLSVLRDARRRYLADAAARLQGKYIKDFDDATGRAEYVLTLNQYDRDFYRRTVQDEQVTPSIAPSLRSHGLILKAREYFSTRVSDGSSEAGGGEAAFNWNLRIGRVLTDHISVVAVTSSDEDNAASVFETLNDRGIGLSTPDLLRSYLLRKSPDEPARQRIGASWQQVLSLSKDGISVDQFLRHFWVSQRGDVKARSLYREIKARLEDEGVDPLVLSESLAASAQVYRDLVRSSLGTETLREQLEAIAELGASVTYPLLLAAAEGTDEESSTLEELAGFLVSLYVRYSVVGGRESTVLEGAIYAAAKRLREDRDYAAIQTELSLLVPDLTEFRRQFRRLSVSRTATQRYLLRAMEHRMRTTEEVVVASPRRVHVEHIYPQRPPTPAKLPRHTGLINRLGNLTLLSRRLNQQIRNSDFQTKKAQAYGASEILMTAELLTYGNTWSADEIDARQTVLAQRAVAIWSFSGEAVPAEDEPPSAREAASAPPEAEEPLDPERLPEIPDAPVALED